MCVRHNRNSDGWLVLAYVISDVAAVTAAYLATFYLRFHSPGGSRFFTVINLFLRVRPTGSLNPLFREFYVESAPRIIALLCIAICLLYAFFNLYAIRRFLRPRNIGWNIVRANFAALILFYGYFYLTRNEFHPRSMFFTIMTLNAIFAMIFRGTVRSFLNFLHSRFGIGDYPAIMLGSGHDADAISRLIGILKPHGIRIATHLSTPADAPWPELEHKLTDACREHHGALLICVDPKIPVARIMQILALTETLGMAAKIFSPHLRVLFAPARMPVELIREIPLVHFARPIAQWRLRLGQFLSRLCAAMALIVLAPLLILTAGLIRVTSRGAAFFMQERIGINRHPFTMFKFRTMHTNAEEQLAAVEEFNESGQGLFKIRHDPRVTPFGRFLRRFSLDELPQLINVIQGEMNVIGPRPLPRRDYQHYYEEWHYSRHSGLPGLTCLWQVSGRSDIDFHNMCILDVYYLRNRNAILDAKIMLRTFGVVLFAKGAY